MTGEKAPITSSSSQSLQDFLLNIKNKTLSSCGRSLVADKCPRAASNLTLKLINKTKQRSEKCVGTKSIGTSGSRCT